MFPWDRSKRNAQKIADQEAEVRRLAAIPFPQAAIPKLDITSEEMGAYEQVAQSIGFVAPKLIRARLLYLFQVENIPLYDYGQVYDWLTKKRIEAMADLWSWIPLREKDYFESVWGRDLSGKLKDGCHYKYDCPCKQLVPKFVLEKVGKIEEKFGGQVKFFVSEYRAAEESSFIMVRPASQLNSGWLSEYLLIFDTWDKPEFEL